jgi:23S rRNA (adenine2503-C2)-methyltransferase
MDHQAVGKTAVKPCIYDLDLQEMTALIQEWGQPAYRARQIYQGIYPHLARGAGEIPSIPKDLRERLEGELDFHPLTPLARARSADSSTEKVLFALLDGAKVETVLMRYRKRRTLCISTQVGCAMGCTFCATGQMGFIRHLATGEIVAQVVNFARSLKERDDRLTNVVVMGMGEPLHNYEATLKAIRILNDPQGFALAARRITISTVGLIPGMDRLAGEGLQINLAVSLHAADDELRTRLVPLNLKYPLPQLMAACRRYFERTHRRLTFEWALIEGVNDSLEQAQALAELLHGLPSHVNLIPLNPTAGFPGAATPRDRALAFKEVLESHHIPCTLRLRRGIDIQAGCGQLATDADRAAREDPPPPG